MIRKLLVASALALATAAPASAAQFIVSFNQSFSSDGIANDFAVPAGGLSTAGLEAFAAGTGLSLSLDGPASIEFWYVGSESAFSNRFTAGSLNSADVGVETSPGYDGGAGGAFLPVPVAIGSVYYAGGPITDWAFHASNGFNSAIGASNFGFGIYLPTVLGLGSYTYNDDEIYLGFDDHGGSPEDNHDDLIILAKVSAVPEASTWAMLIAGFVTVGAALRRRTSSLRLRQAV